MHLAHKIELKPTKEQAAKLQMACWCARFAYNWGLNRWQELYKEYKKDKTKPKPTASLIKKEFNSIKEQQFPWIYESPKDANQQAFANLDNAYKRMFKKLSKYPKFKKKKNNESFYVSNDRLKLNGFLVKLPLIGVIEMTEQLRFQGKILSAVVSKRAHKWFISVAVDTTIQKENNVKNDSIGIDLGLKSFATLSTGETIESPKYFRKLQKQLRRRQKEFSRRKNGNKNRTKSALKVSRTHYKIFCQRNDFLHKLSTKICRENQTICLEDLAVKNMMKNRKLAKSIGDAGWGEFRRQLEYKSKIFGNNIVIADRFYASSKTCSNCGHKKKKLSLGERTFTCEICSVSLDRDLNAAINLSRLGHSRIYACGHDASTGSDKELACMMVEARTQVYTL